jgi:BON domain
MKRNALLFAAVLALASWALAQQPTSPAPPAGSPPPSPGATASPSGVPAMQPPDSPAPPPSPDAGRTPSNSGERAPNSQSQGSGQAQDSSAAQDRADAAGEAQNNPGRPLTSDEARRQIERKLQTEPGLSSRDIHVDVTDNAVVLNGSVPTTNQSLLAQRIAQSFAGSRRISNNLKIQTGSPGTAGSSSGQPQQAAPPENQGGQNPPRR